ncbi:TRAP transporter small permease [Halomonas sp. HP20-15]|uniref:TRAP transporter small permease subunit n=1 Tax=Halomonas sp. HP20-15 TaxID=3085901 RepID=UPI002981EA24|nr:TRAP transporter small permease [Halomonas sp. HP20-15]MDW5376019.1 TRAP transporter small permease [Halomonas sp. HP20-15]
MAHTSSHSSLPKRGVTGGYIHLMDKMSGGLAVLAAIALGAGVLAVCHMVFMRYVLDQSTVWQTEFAVFSVTAAMLLGAPYVLMTGGHVAVTVLPDALGGRLRKAMLLIASLVGLSFCIALTYGAWLYLLEAWHGGWTTGTVWNPPLWPALLPMAIGASLLSLQYVAEILRGESEHGSSH